jgi:hypothetical protein
MCRKTSSCFNKKTASLQCSSDAEAVSFFSSRKKTVFINAACLPGRKDGLALIRAGIQYQAPEDVRQLLNFSQYVVACQRTLKEMRTALSLHAFQVKLLIVRYQPLVP